MFPSAAGMNLKVVLYIASCAVALLYLGLANAHGYVPFASPTSKSSEHTANHFHK
ncbi:MAG: hypothetical protein ABSH33_04900 [Steroidobacteraceae bacterium]|jgi:hypothetical protein